MAIPWIKVEINTPDKPEVIKMARILRLDQDAVFGKVLRVWIWADQHSIDGCNVPLTDDFIARLTGVKQFACAMRTVGWLVGEDGDVTFPNFGHHNGDTAKARAESARRMNKTRNKRQQSLQESAADVADSAQQKAQPDKIRLDKSTNNNNDDNAQAHTRGGAGENGGGGGSGTCLVTEALTWAESYSKGNVLMLVITPEIVHAWHDNRQASGWVTVKNQVELPIADWKADLRTYARSWRDRERSVNNSTKHQAPSTKHDPPKPESAWSLQQRITAAEDQIRRILGIDKFSNLSKADQDRITTIRTNIATWRRQLTEAPAA